MNEKLTNPSLNFRYSILILLGALCITLIGFGILLATLHLGNASRGTSFITLAFSVPALSILILVFVRQFLQIHGLRWNALGFVRPTKSLLHLLWQLPVILLGLIIVQAIVFGVMGAQPASQVNGLDAIMAEVPLYAVVILFVGVAILVPLWEEMLFRGVVYRGLQRKWGIAIALIFSSGLFALIHIAPILLPYLFAMGAAWVWLYESHKTLFAPVIGHIFINTLVTVPVLLFVLV